MDIPVRILVDWGGTITKEKDLFCLIAEFSNNRNPKFDNPDCWDKIRRIGKNNYFDEIQVDFFKMAEIYATAPETISSFCGKSGLNSDSEISIVFDKKPNLTYDKNNVEFDFARAINKNKIESNGLYVTNDKLSLVKNNGFDIVVDDDPRVLLSLCSVGIKGVLMLREWNRLFNLTDLKMSIRYDKYKKICENFYFCEDWYDAAILLGKLVDQKKLEDKK